MQFWTSYNEAVKELVAEQASRRADDPVPLYKVRQALGTCMAVATGHACCTGGMSLQGVPAGRICKAYVQGMPAGRTWFP